MVIMHLTLMQIVNDLKIEIADFGSQSFGIFLVVQILSLNTNTTLLVESFPDTTYNLLLWKVVWQQHCCREDIFNFKQR